MRYQTWHSWTDRRLHIICHADEKAFDALPDKIRHLGPWGRVDGCAGDISRLKAAYRALVAEQQFVLVYRTGDARFEPEPLGRRQMSSKD